MHFLSSITGHGCVFLCIFLTWNTEILVSAQTFDDCSQAATCNSGATDPETVQLCCDLYNKCCDEADDLTCDPGNACSPFGPFCRDNYDCAIGYICCPGPSTSEQCCIIPEPPLGPSTTAAPTTVETTVPTTVETTVPTTVETTVPTTVETTVPTTVETTVPTSEATTVPTSAETTVPTSAETTVPTSAETTVPTSADTTVPTSAETTVPTSAETTVPTSAETTVPTSTETTVSTESTSTGSSSTTVGNP